MDSLKPSPLYDQNACLAEVRPVVWFLGCGVGGATGLALAYAFFALAIAAPIWIAVAATFVAAVHASIIIAFWRYREVVRRRTALIVAMIASAVLTCSLAWIIGSNGMRSSPLYGLAFMHLIMAFCHPANFTTKQATN